MDAASAVICWHNKILLFHRDDIPTIPDPDHWHLPGGQMDPGETPDECIRRELFEEVTHIPEKLEHLGDFKAANNSNRYLYIAFVGDREASLFKHKPGEGQEIGFFTIAEALNLKLTTNPRLYLTKYGHILAKAMIDKKIPHNLFLA